MNATMRFIVWGTIPIGSVMGGVLATVLPVRAALILAALASFVSVVPILASPLWSLREIPAEGQVAGSTAPGSPDPVLTAAQTTKEAGLL
jgi:hypothetical protein